MSANADAIGIPVSELETPALVLDLDVYRRNLKRMADFIIRDYGLAWRPHMKGQKAPQLALEAVKAGACGVTCATLYEAEAMVAAGVKSVLLANQLAGARKQARLARLAKKATGLMTATDSLEHATQLNAAALAAKTVIAVLVEVDAGMNRCGIAPGEPAAQLAMQISEMPGLKFMGVMAWEGHTVPMEGDAKRVEIEASMKRLTDSADACEVEGLAVEIVSASGSGTFMHSAPTPGLTEVQAGGGAFCDLNYQKWGLENEFALTVLTRVVSRPTLTRIVVDGGFKTMSVQHGAPRPAGVGATKCVSLNAEHGVIELEAPDAGHQVGETVTWIPGYTDSTVCLHDEICVCRKGVLEAVWAVPGRTGRR